MLDPQQGRGQASKLGVKAEPQAVQRYRGNRAGKHVENITAQAAARRAVCAFQAYAGAPRSSATAPRLIEL